MEIDDKVLVFSKNARWNNEHGYVFGYIKDIKVEKDFFQFGGNDVYVTKYYIIDELGNDYICTEFPSDYSFYYFSTVKDYISHLKELKDRYISDINYLENYSPSFKRTKKER